MFVSHKIVRIKSIKAEYIKTCVYEMYPAGTVLHGWVSRFTKGIFRSNDLPNMDIKSGDVTEGGPRWKRFGRVRAPDKSKHVGELS